MPSSGASRPSTCFSNNGDRKGGHLLVGPDGRIWGIDHGLCFHVQPKLRTVMWDFAGEELPDEVLAGCELVADAVPEPVAALLEPDECEALSRRAARCCASPASLRLETTTAPIPGPSCEQSHGRGPTGRPPSAPGRRRCRRGSR